MYFIIIKDKIPYKSVFFKVIFEISTCFALLLELSYINSNFLITEFFMSRKAYISDHLLYMGDRLKRNYEKLHQNNNDTAADAADSSNENEPEKVDHSEAPKKHYLPSIRKNNGIEHKNDRERRELEGRVIHDLAQSECELDLLQNELDEVRKFNLVLKKTHARLMEIAESQEQIDLAPLQAEYFAASGRRKAFAKNIIAPSDNTVFESTERSNLGNWIIAGAIIASGAIVSLVLLGIFS